MSWYKTGQINITNGSQTVVGVGTNFARFVESGEALLAPDGRHYEIATVLSATELRLVSSYTGATAANQSYAIVPVQGYVRELAHKAADLIDAHKTVPAEALSYAESAEQSAATAAVSSAQALTRANAAGVSASESEQASLAANAAKTSAQDFANAAAESASSSSAAAVFAEGLSVQANQSASSAAASALLAQNAKSSAQAEAALAQAAKADAQTASNSASANAVNAAASADAASQSELASGMSEIAAAASEAAAHSAKVAAELSNAAAASSAAESATSASAARASKEEAAATVSVVTEARDAALAHTATAKAWADKLDGEVEPGKYSARYWAQIIGGAATGGVVYMGTLNAAGGAFPSSPSRGHLYKVSTAGEIDGVNYSVKDMIIYNGESWDKIDATDEVTSVAGKVGAVTLTKTDVGLENVDNTSDANKPVSAAAQTALNAKVDKVAGKGLSTEDYTTAEKSKLAGVAAGAQVNTVTSVAGKTGAVTLVKGDVGLGNVDNTSDLDKPVSTAVQTALNAKEETVAAGTAAQFWRGDKTWTDFATTVRTSVLTGLSTATNSAIAAADSVLVAFGKLQAQITAHFGAGGAAHSAATSSVNGFMSGADKAKLDAIAAGATANSTDAQLRDRATHTGAQAISTVAGLQAALDGKAAAFHGHTVADVSGLQAALDGTVKTTGNQSISGEKTFDNSIFLRGGSPTLFLKNTTHLSSMVHVAWNNFYILRGEVNSNTWTAVNGQWPLAIDLTNNNATFGGHVTATGNVTAYSDIRLKTDLTKIAGALGKVCALNGYTYTRKDTGERQTGVVAQEVQKVLPEAVVDNGEILSVAYGNMVGLLVEAIKELKSEVDQLKGK